MEDKFEVKIKRFLPYIIVIAAIYLFLPIILVITGQSNQATFLTEIIYIGVFPLTALLTNMVYAYKNKSDFLLSLVAPIVYIPSALLYGNFKANVAVTIIYLVAYFVCGFLGLILGDLFYSTKEESKKEEEEEKPERPVAHPRTPTRVSRRAIKETEEEFNNSKPLIEDDYDFGDSSTTAEDIDEILREIHNRNKS